jgi:hypothetical protein
MDAAARDRAERRRERAEDWPIRAYRLGEEPLIDPLDHRTIDERLATMWPLARAAWSVAGMPIPSYTRREAPGVVTRGRKVP